MRIDLPDPAATDALGARLAGMARRGDAILLSGDYGAGKSSLARAFLRAASGDAALEVPSPSFTLVQSYETRLGMVHHLDLWRLDGPGGLVELGWEEMLEDIVLVEWPERLEGAVPVGALSVGLSLVGAGRVAVVSGWGGRW